MKCLLLIWNHREILSVFKHDDIQPVLALITDGVIQNRHLEIIGKTEEWLVKELKKQGVNDVKQIFYCSFENGELKFQLKEEYQ